VPDPVAAIEGASERLPGQLDFGDAAFRSRPPHRPEIKSALPVHEVDRQQMGVAVAFERAA